MRTALTAVAVAVAVAVAAGAVRAADDDQAKAKAVVEKAVAAAGWEKNGANVAQTWKDKGTFTLGEEKLEYTADWYFSGPDKYRFDLKGKFGGADMTLTAVANADKAWGKMNDESESFAGDKLEYTRNEVYKLWVYTLTPLLTEKGFTLKPVAGVKVDGNDTAGVEVGHKDRPTVTLYFDAKTHLLVKSVASVKNEFDGWKETTEETLFGGWKEGADKKKQPTKLTIVRGGKTLIESDQSGHKYHDKLEDKLFEPLK